MYTRILGVCGGVCVGVWGMDLGVGIPCFPPSVWNLDNIAHNNLLHIITSLIKHYDTISTQTFNTHYPGHQCSHRHHVKLSSAPSSAQRLASSQLVEPFCALSHRARPELQSELPLLHGHFQLLPILLYTHRNVTVQSKFYRCIRKSMERWTIVHKVLFYTPWKLHVNYSN